MKNKKEFVPLLENSQQFISKKRSIFPGHSVIKNSDIPQDKKIEKIQWNDVNLSVSEVKLIENQGKIEAIKVQCSCGCSTLIQFEYDEDASEKILN